MAETPVNGGGGFFFALTRSRSDPQHGDTLAPIITLVSLILLTLGLGLTTRVLSRVRVWRCGASCRGGRGPPKRKDIEEILTSIYPASCWGSVKGHELGSEEPAREAGSFFGRRVIMMAK